MSNTQVDLSDRSIRQIVDGLLTAQRMGGGPIGGGGGGNAGSGLLDFLGNTSVTVTGAFTNALSKATTGNLKFTDLLGASTQVLGLFGNAGNLLNVTLLKGVASFYEVNEQLKKTSESGFYFSNDLLNFSESVTGARLSTDQFINFVRENGSRITFLGTGADDSARKLLSFSKTLQDGDLTTKNFLKLGGSSEELAEILSITALGMRAVNLEDDKNKAAVTKTTTNLITEFDNLARITGVSRKQSEESLRKELTKVEVGAYLAGLEGTARKQFIENSAKIMQYGPGISDLFNQMQAFGGPITKSAAATAASLGTARQSFDEYALAVKQGRNEEEVKALYSKFQAEMAKNQMSEQSLYVTKLAGFNALTSDYAKAMADNFKYNQNKALDEQAFELMQRDMQQGRLRGDLEFYQNEIREKALQGKELAETGAEGTKIATTINEINQNIATASGGIAANLSKFNGKIEEMIKGIDNAMGISKAFAIGGSLSSIEDARRTLGGEFVDKLLGNLQTQSTTNQEYKEKGLAPIGRTEDIIRSNEQGATASKDIIDSLKNEMSNLTGAITKLSTSSPGAVSNTENTGLLNSAVEQLGKISNTMRDLLTATQDSLRQLKDVAAGVSNNRGR